MFLAGGLIALLAGGTVMSIPGGVLVVPAGCKGPSVVPMGVDAFFGVIECKQEELSIRVSGDATIRDACSLPSWSPYAGEKVQLSHPYGPMSVCSVDRKDATSGKITKEMMIELGGFQLISEIRNPRHAFLLLQIAMSFRHVNEKGRK
jgi:hypothetical protein